MNCYIQKNINNKKRKLNECLIINNTSININNLNDKDKIALINFNNNNNKRKMNVVIREKSKKIKKNNYCSIHENLNICNMYECSGGSHFITNNHSMPYIV